VTAVKFTLLPGTVFTIFHEAVAAGCRLAADALAETASAQAAAAVTAAALEVRRWRPAGLAAAEPVAGIGAFAGTCARTAWTSTGAVTLSFALSKLAQSAAVRSALLFDIRSSG